METGPLLSEASPCVTDRGQTVAWALVDATSSAPRRREAGRSVSRSMKGDQVLGSGRGAVVRAAIGPAARIVVAGVLKRPVGLLLNPHARSDAWTAFARQRPAVGSRSRARGRSRTRRKRPRRCLLHAAAAARTFQLERSNGVVNRVAALVRYFSDLDSGGAMDAVLGRLERLADRLEKFEASCMPACAHACAAARPCDRACREPAAQRYQRTVACPAPRHPAAGPLTLPDPCA